jgi:hypothetical protein
LGVRFQIDGQDHYGWMQLRSQYSLSNIYGFAYNTVPNQPILAGQVPEPATWVLFLAGGVALLRWRRLRNGK